MLFRGRKRQLIIVHITQRKKIHDHLTYMASEILLFAVILLSDKTELVHKRNEKKYTCFVMKSHEHSSYQTGLSHLLLSVKPYTQLSTPIVSLIPYLLSTLTNPIP